MNKKEFMESCGKIVGRESSGELSIQEAANKICSLCNNNIELVMPELSEVMNIACDLELPDEHRDRPLEDWEKLKSELKRASESE
ncbi:MAG TPA: hypothetical protein VGE62_03045 [Candidatus Paceibacterota bacterium]